MHSQISSQFMREKQCDLLIYIAICSASDCVKNCINNVKEYVLYKIVDLENKRKMVLLMMTGFIYKATWPNQCKVMRNPLTKHIRDKNRTTRVPTPYPKESKTTIMN